MESDRPTENAGNCSPGTSSGFSKLSGDETDIYTIDTVKQQLTPFHFSCGASFSQISHGLNQFIAYNVLRQQIIVVSFDNVSNSSYSFVVPIQPAFAFEKAVLMCPCCHQVLCGSQFRIHRCPETDVADLLGIALSYAESLLLFCSSVAAMSSDVLYKEREDPVRDFIALSQVLHFEEIATIQYADQESGRARPLPAASLDISSQTEDDDTNKPNGYYLNHKLVNSDFYLARDELLKSPYGLLVEFDKIHVFHDSGGRFDETVIAFARYFRSGWPVKVIIGGETSDSAPYKEPLVLDRTLGYHRRRAIRGTCPCCGVTFQLLRRDHPLSSRCLTSSKHIGQEEQVHQAWAERFAFIYDAALFALSIVLDEELGKRSSSLEVLRRDLTHDASVAVSSEQIRDTVLQQNTHDEAGGEDSDNDPMSKTV